MFKQSVPVALVLMMALVMPSMATADGVTRPDSHAPITVMGDHLHKQGEWMMSYRYMHMDMDGNRSGSERISDAEAFALVPGVSMMAMMNMKVLPTDMEMKMHMLGVMYAPTDSVTLMAMLPHLTSSMNHRRQMNGMEQTGFQTATEGFGDASIGALVGLYDQGQIKTHLNLGIGLPTGSITEQDDTPMGEQQLPYAMQLGSGSYEIRPGATVYGLEDGWSWGAQVGARLALDTNEQGYRLGDRYQVSAWLAKPINNSLSASVLIRKSWWDDVEGEAEDLMISPNMNPAADPDQQAGQRTDLGLGINYLFQAGSLKGHRLALEWLQPLQQSLHGPRLETDSVLTLGWQKAFSGRAATAEKHH